MKCPKCNADLIEDADTCPNCNFDIQLYNITYSRILQKKIQLLDAPKNAEKQNSSQNTPASFIPNNQVHRPRCPYCNSENLTKITSFDRAVNAAMFGLLGNKRKYQWHCNNCKTNW